MMTEGGAMLSKKSQNYKVFGEYKVIQSSL